MQESDNPRTSHSEMSLRLSTNTSPAPGHGRMVCQGLLRRSFLHTDCWPATGFSSSSSRQGWQPRSVRFLWSLTFSLITHVFFDHKTWRPSHHAYQFSYMKTRLERDSHINLEDTRGSDLRIRRRSIYHHYMAQYVRWNTKTNANITGGETRTSDIIR